MDEIIGIMLLIGLSTLVVLYFAGRDNTKF